MNDSNNRCCNCTSLLPPKHRRYCPQCSALASTLWKRQFRLENRGCRYWFDHYLKKYSTREAALEAYRSDCRLRARRYRAKLRAAHNLLS